MRVRKERVCKEDCAGVGKKIAQVKLVCRPASARLNTVRCGGGMTSFSYHSATSAPPSTGCGNSIGSCDSNSRLLARPAFRLLKGLGPRFGRGASPSPAFPVPPRSKGSEAAGCWEREQSGTRILDRHHLRLQHQSKGSGSPPVHTYLIQCTKLQR